MEDSAARKCGARPYIGVNYGEVADNLSSPDATASLLKWTTISKVRLYGVDANLLRALAGSGISVVVGVANGDIPSLAADMSATSRWLAANMLPFIPATTISVVAVGNEVLESGDELHNVLDGGGFDSELRGDAIHAHWATLATGLSLVQLDDLLNLRHVEGSLRMKRLLCHDLFGLDVGEFNGKKYNAPLFGGA